MIICSKYRYLTVFLLTVPLLLLCQNKEADEIFNIARSLAKSGRYEESRKLYLQVIEKNPSQSPGSYYNIACSYANQGDTLQAIAWLEKAIDKGFWRIAWALHDDEDFKNIRGLSEFQQVLTKGRQHIKHKYFPQLPAAQEISVDSCLKVAGILITIDDFEDAITFIKRAWILGKEETIILYNCNDRLPYLRREPHIKNFMDSISTQLKDGYLCIELAKYYVLAEDINGAFNMLERAIQIKPDLNYRFLMSDSEFDSIRSDKKFKALIQKLAETNRDKIYYTFTEGRNFPESVYKFNISLASKDEIPSDINIFENLKEFAVSYPKGKSIPSSIGLLKKLTKISFLHTSINDIPFPFFQLPILEYVEIRGHRIRALPDSMFSMPELKTLIIADGNIDKLPINIGSLVALERLSLSNNYLTSLPEQIQQLKRLRGIDISDNCFSTVSKTLKNLDSIQVIDLSLNQIDIVPSWLGELELLDTLDLAFNNIADFPVDSFRKSKVKYINLYGNNIASETIAKIKKLMPNCKIVANLPNVFTPIEPKGWKTYNSYKYQFEFQYPSFLTVSEIKSEIDGGEFSIFISVPNKSSEEQDESKEYSQEIEITITIGQFGFRQVIKNGFENGPKLKSNDASVESEEAWYSLSREGMKVEAKPIIYSHWRGLCRNNKGEIEHHLGHDDFFNAAVIQKIKSGKSASIEYYDASKKPNNIFEMILTSFRFSH